MSLRTALFSSRRLAGGAIAAATGTMAIHPSPALAQTSTAFTACTQGSLANCALIQLSSGTALGSSYFEIMIRNLGSPSGFPTSIDFLSFAAGGQNLGSGVADGHVTPTAVGGATLTDLSAWDIFVGSDAIFLSALSNHGVGGCVTGADVDVFGQAGNTCGPDAFLAFRFNTPLVFDPSAVTLLDMQVTRLTDPLSAEFCSDTGTCQITAAPVAPLSSVPEPSTIILSLTGLSAVAAWKKRSVLIRGRVQN
jgi:hypothetical protein